MRLLAVDGKTLRRSPDRRHRLGPLHLVSVWASEQGLTSAQVATAEKSNEITAIPLVLELVDLKGAVVTIDARGCQKAIVKKIVERGGDYVKPGLGRPVFSGGRPVAALNQLVRWRSGRRVERHSKRPAGSKQRNNN